MNLTHTTRGSLDYSKIRTDPTTHTDSDWIVGFIVGGVIISIVIVLLVISAIISRKKRVKEGKSSQLEHNLRTVETPISQSTQTPEEQPPNTPENRPVDKVLGWNKILQFLARNLHASTWLMFFDCLYDNTKLPEQLNYQERIRRLEIDVRMRSHSCETLLLEQFKSWKEAAGNNASPDVIETTLTQLGHMDTLEEFKNYMRNPPYVEPCDHHLSDEEDDIQLSKEHLVSIPSVERLIETFVQTEQEITPDMYNFTTRNTIDELVKSGLQKKSALCLRYSDYSEIESIRTKKGDNYLLCIGGIKRHMLLPSSFEKLKFYADHVRSKLSHRLGGLTAEADNYMFVSYDGVPLFMLSHETREDINSGSISMDSETHLKQIVHLDSTYTPL